MRRSRAPSKNGFADARSRKTGTGFRKKIAHHHKKGDEPGPTSSEQALAMAGDVILSARGLTVAFPRQRGEAHVVDDLALDIRAGEFVGLMGQPGCGKSSAAAALMGLVKPP